ncbi:MAG: trypsin-like peptidase domain-containing protein [Gammaproteobacteria bacterium]
MISNPVRVSVALVLFASQAGAAATGGVSLDAARSALASGDAATAVTMYEALTQQGESLEAELGLVASGAAGRRVRKAMSWATLTAGEHTESSDAVALLAYMHDRVGHTEQALATLRQLRVDRPNDPVAAAALSNLLIDRGGDAGTPNAKSVSLAWLRPSFEPIPVASSRVLSAGNGVIVEGGQRVLTYSAVLPKGATAIYVRNGLGKVRRAVREAGDQKGALVRLRLTTSYPAAWALPPDQVVAPEGVRFCFALGYSSPRNSAGAYPAVSPGIVFRADAGVGGLMQVTSAPGAGNIGSPVFDPRGRLLGLSVGTGDIVIEGQNLRRSVGAGQFAIRAMPAQPAARDASGAAPPRPAGPVPPMPAIEELYERLTPSVVQIVAVE